MAFLQNIPTTEEEFKCVLVTCNVALACSSEFVSESGDFSKISNSNENVNVEYFNTVFTVIKLSSA